MRRSILLEELESREGDAASLASFRRDCVGEWHLGNALRRDGGIPLTCCDSVLLANSRGFADRCYLRRGLALHVVCRRGMGTLYAGVGGSILAAGIVTLHYTDMGAMRLAARCEFNPFLVSLSVVFAIVFAVGGLWIESYFRDARGQKMVWRRIGGAMAMGAANTAMHYIWHGLGDLSVFRTPPDLTHAVNVSFLSTIGIAVVTLILLGSVIIASLVDRGFSAQALLLALSEARLEVAREARLEIMGELTASIAHEINQPLTAIVTNGEFCLRNLSSGRPDQKRLREAVTEIVHDGNRASSIISRIRALLMKGAHEHAQLDINHLIQKVLDLTQNEITSNQSPFGPTWPRTYPWCEGTHTVAAGPDQSGHEQHRCDARGD